MIERILPLLIFSFVGGRVLAQSPTAVLTPAEGFNASLGSPVTFNCNVAPAGNADIDIIWRVNGESNPTELSDRGIVILTNIIQPDGMILSRIVVASTFENDGIQIQCRAATDNSVGSSSVVTFRVQGLLASPSALEITDQGSMQRLSWEAPDTLDLTNEDPDIRHYNVCTTILSEVSCKNVQALEYTFAAIRTGIEFSVAAVNVVGEGNVSNTSYQPCDPGTAPSQVDANSVNTEISLQSEGTSPSVSFSFEQGSGDPDCFDLYRIQALPSNQATPLMQGPVIPTVSGQGSISLRVESGLTRSTIYNATITSVNVNGENSSTGDIRFSTYDVQSIETSARPGAVAVTCTFTAGSTVINCVVNICEVVEGAVTESCGSLNVPRAPSSLTSIQQLDGLQTGVYVITEVSMRNSDGTSENFTPEDLEYLRLENVQVTVPPPPTTTATPTGFTTGPSGSLNAPEANVGVIVGAVIGVVVVIIILVVLIALVLFCLYKRNETQDKKSGAARLTTTEMWLDDSSHESTKQLTMAGEAPPPNLSPGYNLGQQPTSPLSDMAVIQGKNGCHVEINLSEEDIPEKLELDSVELTEPVGASYRVTSPPSPPYDSMEPAQPDILQHRGPVAVVSTSRPNSGVVDRLATEDVHEIKLAASLDNLARERRNNGHMRSLSADLMDSQSVDSLNSQGQYAEIDHRRTKKSKKPKDSDLVLYSEINVEELRPIVPQKKRSKPSITGSLNYDPRLESYHV